MKSQLSWRHCRPGQQMDAWGLSWCATTVTPAAGMLIASHLLRALMICRFTRYLDVRMRATEVTSLTTRWERSSLLAHDQTTTTIPPTHYGSFGVSTATGARPASAVPANPRSLPRPTLDPPSSPATSSSSSTTCMLTTLIGMSLNTRASVQSS